MLPVLAALAEDPASDPRLRAPMSVEERYLPLTELAARARKATGAEVKVEGSLSERKLALFVKGRPASETMRMAASALRAQWDAVGDVWVLRLDPEVAREEAAAVAVVDRLQREAVAKAFAERIEEVKKADEEGGQVDSTLRTVVQLIEAAGAVRAAESILAGKPLYGADSGGPGVARIAAAQALAGVSLRGPDGPIVAKSGFATLRLDQSSREVEFVVRSTGLGGASMMRRMTVATTGLRVGPPKSALDRREEEWAKVADRAVAFAPLADLPPLPDPYGREAASLADVLARLHARTGLPMVAESFRVPVAGWIDRPGKTLAEVLKIPMGPPPKVFYSDSRTAHLDFRGPAFSVRTEEGWLLARFPGSRYLRPGEIPERLLTPLENRESSLDGLATLAGRLTEAQRAALADDRPLAAFPVSPLREGYRGLWVYDAVPTGLRGAAKNGVALSRLPAPARDRWARVVREAFFDGGVSDDWLEPVRGGSLAAASFMVAEGSWMGSRLRDPRPGWTFLFGLADLAPLRVLAPLPSKAP